MAFKYAQDSERSADDDVLETLSAARRIVDTVLADYQGQVAIRLWDGQTIMGTSAASCTVVFREAGPLRELILQRDLLRLAEAYLNGSVDAEGNMEALFDLAPYLESLRLTIPDKLRLLLRAWRLPSSKEMFRARASQSNSKPQPNSRACVAHHYDVGNDFYALWLDPERVYSCAYFKENGQELAAAQRDKLDYICRKLRLAPGQSLLDIGCGWGALACWAARHYGVAVHGITLSVEQYRYANDRIRTEGLADRVKIEIRDYRDLQGKDLYDRVVSIGMFEHVGVANFEVYFKTVKRLLKQDGLFLNHGITSETGWRSSPLTTFMNRYVFPDGELARVCQVMEAMEVAGFEVVDVESLRRHYVLTLRCWIEALESRRDRVIAASSDRVFRLWRLYMSGCAHHFEQGETNVYQWLAGSMHHSIPLPLRRDDLYVPVRCIE